MQQIQRTVLNKIEPGKHPIFIIAPDKNDADVLALYLSGSLKVNASIQAEQYDADKRAKNFFSNSDTQRILTAIETNNLKDLQEKRDKIKFILSRDFDNHILWGLQCSYEAFFELQLNELYPNAFYIFLYGAKACVSGERTESELLNTVHEFYNAHTGNAVVVHVNNTIGLSEQILQALPIDPAIVKTNTNPVKPVYALSPSTTAPEATALNKILDSNNILAINNEWPGGDSVLAVLIINGMPAEDVFAGKIIQLATSLVTPPAIHVLCVNNDVLATVSELAKSKFPGLTINTTAPAGNMATAINALISQSTAGTITIDHLQLSYDYVDLLGLFRKNDAPVFAFGNILSNEIKSIVPGRISLQDILATRSISDNITLTKTAWKQTAGFDASLTADVILWDFAIRALLLPGAYAQEVDAELQEVTTSIIEPAISEINYTAVFEKHKAIFSANLEQVLTLISENQHVPQNQIINLTNKISTMDIFLQQSKDELKSLNDYSSNLQKRIRTLESGRFYRLSEKIRHYKKIFFKEKKPGKGTVKKILKFILFVFTKAGFTIVRKIIKVVFRKLYLLAEDKPVRIVYLEDEGNGDDTHIDNYNDWINYKLNLPGLRKEYDTISQSFAIQPKVSIIMPVYDPPLEFLKDAIQSVINQLYTNWELCIADDCSTKPQVKRLINSFMLKDKRIKAVFRTENGHISACSNSALALATGDYVFCLDHDDLLTPNCVSEVVRHINAHPKDELIYSDEDKIDDNGVYSTPYFKPDWAPVNLMAKNYITHIAVLKKQLIDSLGGYRLGFEGSQDYDLMLRATEMTTEIGHIPKVLYHWRIHRGSAAQNEDAKPYAFFAAKRALEESLIRRNTPGEVQFLPGMMGYRVKYKVTSFDKVSIIIPTKDQAGLTKNTIDSLISLTDYPDYEIIVIDNNSHTKEFFDLIDGYKEKHSDIFRCLEAKFPFNFSKLMNLGVAHSNGKYILLLNNDVEITHADWLTRMVSFAQQEKTGAVGVKLLYPDDNIQHAGTVVGLGGVAGHVFVNFHRDNPGYFSYLQSTTNYSAVTAACLMVRKSVYEEVGGMDETLEVEYNDVDFCLKIMDHGYYNIYVPDVVLYHYESATRGHPHQNKVSYERHLRENQYFSTKWQKYILNDPNYNPNLRYDVQDFKINYKA